MISLQRKRVVLQCPINQRNQSQRWKIRCVLESSHMLDYRSLASAQQNRIGALAALKINNRLCERISERSTTTRATGRQLESGNERCRDVNLFLHLFVLSHKLETVSSEAQRFRSKNATLIVDCLTDFRSPCIIDSVLAENMLLKSGRECGYKGLRVPCILPLHPALVVVLSIY